MRASARGAINSTGLQDLPAIKIKYDPITFTFQKEFANSVDLDFSAVVYL